MIDNYLTIVKNIISKITRRMPGTPAADFSAILRVAAFYITEKLFYGNTT